MDQIKYLGRVHAAIRSARADGYVPIIFFHGGNEHCPFPAPSKKELYRHFVDIGVGAVIAMHTHCPQGYEMYCGAPIIYSMGNFYFPAPDYPDRPRYKVWHYGYMCRLDFCADPISVEIIPYKQDFDGIHILEGEQKEYFERYLSSISNPIGDDLLLQKYFDAWCVGRKYISGFVKGVSDGWDADIRNMLCCEAHNDVLRTEARIRFEEDERSLAALEALLDDIFELQEMRIPEALINQ